MFLIIKEPFLVHSLLHYFGCSQCLMVLETVAALKCTQVPWKLQVCVLVWRILFLKGLSCCHCWKSSWEPEKSFLCGRWCWNCFQLEQERHLNSSHGAKMLRSRACCELCSCAELSKVDFSKCESLRFFVNANVLQPVLYSGSTPAGTLIPLKR